MGIGDSIIGSGIARDAWTKRGVKIAFGDGQRVIWDKHSKQVFDNNPNIVFPGNERNSGKIEWVAYYKGNRGYNTQGDGHWIWNLDWRCKPGEIYLTHGEEAAGKRQGSGFVVIEPNVPWWKSSARNKDWGYSRYQQVVEELQAMGRTVVQFVPPDGGQMLGGVKQIRAATFRDAVAVLKNAALYVGAEGGLHHAAAALGVKAVVLFGGFIPPSVTGYDSHVNLVGSDTFCGSFTTCVHCRAAMNAIPVEAVTNAVKGLL